MKQKNNLKLVVLFSGGTDSTLATLLKLHDYEEIHLLTYYHRGIGDIDNSKNVARTFQSKFSDKKFVHKIVDIDSLYRFFCYENYFKNVRQHKLFMLSTCGFCKLAMHVQTIYYCQKNQISDVIDGANSNMSIYPAQMPDIVKLIHDLYQNFDLNFCNPVFNYALKESARLYQTELVEKLGVKLPNVLNDGVKDNFNSNVSTEDKLHELGFVPSADIKGTEYDKKRQGKCLQLTLLRTFAEKIYLSKHSKEEYIFEQTRLFNNKIDVAKKLLSCAKLSEKYCTNE